MHPILARGSRLALYLGVWTLVGVLLAALLAGPGGLARDASARDLPIPLALVYAFFCLSAWYVSRSTPLGPTGAVRLVATALTASVDFERGLAGCCARLARAARAGQRTGAGRPVPGGARADLRIRRPALPAVAAVSYLLAAFERSREAERRGLEAQVLAREAELRSLRTQIDPHFLFNSLHSISALTTADPPAARRMCVLLGDFLRDSLALGSEDRITIGRELQLAERFLEIERVRFGDRLAIERPTPPRMAHGSCRHCCCSRSWRTRSPTAWLTCSRAARRIRISVARPMAG